MNVLVADDDGLIRDTLSVLLDQLGHQAVLAKDGTEAWDILVSPDAPRLAIIDWIMPGVDGLEICRRVRGMGKAPYQYLLMLTAKDGMQDLVDSIESGADDYMSKPFDERELRARLHAGERILALQEELRARATFDSLTKLLNRDTILERLQRELSLAGRGRPMPSIILADLDDFKMINDTHGHAAGDDVLREASRRMATRMRSYDELGRYGGEEFLVVLPACEPPAAAAVAERMRLSLDESPIETSGGAVRPTVSLGVAGPELGKSTTVDALLAKADQALYRAKRAGRNRVEVA